MRATDERVRTVGRKFRFSILEDAGVPSGAPLELTAAVALHRLPPRLSASAMDDALNFQSEYTMNVMSSAHDWRMGDTLGWLGECIKNNAGKPLPILANALIALR